MIATTKKHHKNKIADFVDMLCVDANQKLDKKNRSAFGQYMTPAPISQFMASLFKNFNKDIKLLDAGAGLGSLTASFIERIVSKNNHPNKIKSTLYEIDPLLNSYLKTTISKCKALCLGSNIEFSSKVIKNDFIKAGSGLLCPAHMKNKMNVKYSHAILNPPYKKILSSSDHRKWLRKIGIETSNLYTAFLSVAIMMLQEEGEIVAIIPRSFCNGQYFKPFREFLLREVAFKHIHVFESRTNAFKEDAVLQENIIFHAIKGAKKDKVLITSTSTADFKIASKWKPGASKLKYITEDMTQRVVSYDCIMKPNDPEHFIHIPTSEREQCVVARMSTFNNTLDELGLGIATGPIVDFRLKKDLRTNMELGTAPLLYPVHFKNNNLKWPTNSKKPNAIRISKISKKWLRPNKGHYIVIKRFTSKEEKRRIVATVYDSSLPGNLVGFDNKLNFFHKNQKGFSSDIAHGLAVYLNSTLLDLYFRQFNGNTQVNATDLRNILYPDIKILKKFGRAIKKQIPEQKEIDSLIDNVVEKTIGKVQMNPVTIKEKIDGAINILKAFGLPRAQQNERSALTLLSLLALQPEENWIDAKQPLMGITPIMDFSRQSYGKEYAPNTRETFRRQTMHQFVDAGIAIYNPDQPNRPVNSPKACYQVSPAAFEVIICYETKKWEQSLGSFLKQNKTLSQKYAKERNMKMIPVEVAEGKEINLTPGSHSKLIKDIITEFAPRFAPGSEVIYVGDTGDKVGYFQLKKLKELGVTINKHGKMPDVVLYFKEKEWLLLIESVTSHGPVDGKRQRELRTLFSKAKPGLVYVTAFPSRTIMKEYLPDISWETEVWVAEAPTHLIHFNGIRFLGPYK